MRRIVFVEDTYGKEFHRAVMRKLAESRALNPPANIRIDPRPVRKCDNKLRRLVLSAAASGEATKVLLVIDDEGRPDAVDSDVLRHLRNLPNVDVSIRVVAVSPMHEAWLCIGLGYDRRSCRSDPVGVLRSEKYEKRHLGQWAERMSVDQLMSERDFGEYLDALRWLARDP